MTAHAGDPWDLGNVTLTSTALAPGTNGNSSGTPWYVTWAGGSYGVYAGGFKWNMVDGYGNTSAIATMCASLFQDFNPGSPFGAHEFWLDSATNNGLGTGSTIKIGDGQVETLPGVDTGTPGAETANKFLQAAELFGHLYPTLPGSPGTAQNDAYAALQLAVWHTLYAPNVTVVTGDATTNADYGNDLAALGSVTAADLSHVVWFDHSPDSSQGQSQFGYTLGPPAPTPEPMTIALGMAGLAIGLRRRNSKA